MNSKHPVALGYPRLVTKEELEAMLKEARAKMPSNFRKLPDKKLRKIFYRVIAKHKKQGKLVVI